LIVRIACADVGCSAAIWVKVSAIPDWAIGCTDEDAGDVAIAASTGTPEKMTPVNRHRVKDILFAISIKG
jgi:hypothetical protein